MSVCLQLELQQAADGRSLRQLLTQGEELMAPGGAALTPPLPVSLCVVTEGEFDTVSGTWFMPRRTTHAGFCGDFFCALTKDK